MNRFLHDDHDCHNDLLDKMLDGEPVYIVMTPGLRRALRRRCIEREAKDAAFARGVARRFGAW